jgi:hypothetical protein
MSQPAIKAAHKLLPGEDPDIVEELRKLFDTDPQAWLDTPHEWFWGRKPRELIGTEQESDLRNWIRMVKHGVFT